jgi:GT2 family glycosyltransferase
MLDSQAKYVLFLNPDAFLTPDFLEKAAAQMETRSDCGILTGPLFGYDFARALPTGRYDSTGIFSTWYGRWYDRGQGEAISKDRYSQVEDVPAICGALMFCRKEALESAALEGEVWDSSFFMYKEDIDLSLRVRSQGWRLLYHPDLIAYHGRGWQTDRGKMSRAARLGSAKNEIKLYWKARLWAHLPYSIAKYTAVKLLDI